MKLISCICTCSTSDLSVVLGPLIEELRGEPQEIVVSRRNIFGSFCRALSSGLTMRRPLTIIFAGEDGEDDGGLRREFFWLAT